MIDFPALAFDTLGHTILAVAVGVAIMVATAMAVERILARAVYRRALWQAVLLGLCALLVFELTGTSLAVSSLLSMLRSPEAASSVAPPEPVAVDLSLAMPSLYEDFLFHHDDAFIEYDLTMPGELPPLAWYPPIDVAPATVVETAAPEPAQPPLPSAAVPLMPRQAEAAPIWPTHWLAWGVLSAWVGGVCFLGGRLLRARRRFNQLRRGWKLLDTPDLALTVDDLGRRIGLRRPVRVRTAEGLASPVAFGWWRPTVLVPSDFARRFTEREQQAILAHELTHLASGDPVWLLAAELATAVLWWHPAAYVLRRRLLTAAEQAADEASVLVPGGPDVLADCLVKLGRRMSGRPRIGWVAAEGSGLQSGLAHRVKRLLKLAERKEAATRRRVAPAATIVAAALLVLMTLTCTLWAHPITPPAKGEDSMNVLKVSWRRSLAAAALAAFLGPMATDAPADEEHGDRPAVERAERDREHAERERDDRERDREHAQRERKDREHAEHEGERRHVEMARHQAELREKAGQLERIEMARAKDNPERTEAMQRFHAMARKIHELREAGRHEQAEKLQQEMTHLHERLAASRDREHPPVPERGSPKGLEQLKAMMRKVHELHESDRHEKAEKLERRVHELHDRMTGPRDDDRPWPQPELQAKLNHLRVAMENLHAAGLHDQAEQIERLMRELPPGARQPQLMREPSPEARRPQPRPHPEARPGPQGEVVDQLRGEIERLRHENEEIRDMMNALREGQERLMHALGKRDDD